MSNDANTERGPRAGESAEVCSGSGKRPADDFGNGRGFCSACNREVGLTKPDRVDGRRRARKHKERTDG